MKKILSDSLEEDIKNFNEIILLSKVKHDNIL
jgi:hypothetical protein